MILAAATVNRPSKPAVTASALSTGGGISAIEGCFAFAVAVVIPLFVCAVGQAAILRLAYPAVAFCAAGLLYARNSPWYVGLCVWLFCATPLVRRLIDMQTSWDPSNPALLSPYLACAFAGWGATRLLARAPCAPRSAVPFFVILGCIGYGFLLAMLDERVLSGVVDAMKWSAGPLIALHTLQSGEQRRSVRGVLTFSLLVAAPLMAAYGIAQYIAPMSWDADWMENVKSLGLDSIGVPQPYALRVFSTMNSPGSFGAILMFAIMAAFERRVVVMLPITIVCVLALLLTEYRAVWAGTGLGVLYLGMRWSGSSFVRFAALGLVLTAAIGATALVPQMQDTVFSRFQSLSDLSTDASGEDRLRQYRTFFSDGDESAIIGQGLAIDGASRRLDNKNSNVIDSGVIEIFSVFGIVVGSIFLFALGCSVVRTFSREPRTEMPLYGAAALALFSQLPFGSVFVAESGFCAWLYIGLAAAASDRPHAQMQHSVEASWTHEANNSPSTA